VTGAEEAPSDFFSTLVNGPEEAPSAPATPRRPELFPELEHPVPESRQNGDVLGTLQWQAGRWVRFADELGSPVHGRGLQATDRGLEARPQRLKTQ
jgi:hypothetical protein